MRSYEEKQAEAERLNALLPAVREELMRIPGVSRVAVGIRERGGQLEDETVFRVHVEQKLPESALAPEHRIPKQIRGVPVDVVVKRRPVREIGFNDEDDWKDYSPKVGGSRIGAEVAGGTGTLGCFCRRTTDDKTVLLSNWHVLIDPGGAAGDGVGHPKWRKSCCCVCGKIGVVAASDKPLDCAIAELDSGIAFAPKIRRIRRADGTVEQEGTILGSAPPVAGDEVYKVGARTGLTRGIITDVDSTEIEVTPNAPFPRMSNKGDSGSVYVSLVTGMVCALHHSGDGTLGFGSPFNAVKTALKIEVIPTEPDIEYAVLDWLDGDRRVLADPPFAELAQRMRGTPAGRELLRLMEAHRLECLDLVERRRRFTVAWQRSQGPAYLAALARSARDPAFRIPQRIRGVDRTGAARYMADALRISGSPALVKDLDALGPALMEALIGGDTVGEILRHWEEARLAVPY
ncbi:MAG: hypothetical protein KIT22_02835 [Verrucomicrobiae bacterium]|nr:hypothetical protein [Verrucomicrobiae bacterium]